MTIRSKIERIEKRLRLQAKGYMDPIDELLGTPLEHLKPGEPELSDHNLRHHYAYISAMLDFQKEFPQAFDEKWLAEMLERKSHAETLLPEEKWDGSEQSGFYHQVELTKGMILYTIRRMAAGEYDDDPQWQGKSKPSSLFNGTREQVS
jgi:hypothetical protein